MYSRAGLAVARREPPRTRSVRKPDRAPRTYARARGGANARELAVSEKECREQRVSL